MIRVLVAAVLLAAPAQAQQACSDPELQQAVAVWRSLIESGVVGVGGTPDDYVLTVEERVWVELDAVQQRSLLISADIYAQCVLWPKVMRPENPDTWVCGIKAHTAIAGARWQSPEPVAEIRLGRDGACEFRRLR